VYYDKVFYWILLSSFQGYVFCDVIEICASFGNSLQKNSLQKNRFFDRAKNASPRKTVDI
jgi:hypothetical protein